MRALKHTPAYPRMPFTDSAADARWVAHFVDWYNGEHRHSAIRYVTPRKPPNPESGDNYLDTHRRYKPLPKCPVWTQRGSGGQGGN